MKTILGFLSVCVLLFALLFFAAPDRARALAGRATGYLRTRPAMELPDTEAADATGGRLRAVPAAERGTPRWRQLDRDADRAFLEGDFESAAAIWTEAAEAAIPSEQIPLRSRADQSRVFALLAAGGPASPVGNATALESDLRRRVEAVEKPTAGAWLEVARFAVDKGLRHHLAWLYLRAYERRNDGTNAFQATAAERYRERKSRAGAPEKSLLESLIRELPASEVADLAREDGGGIGGVHRRGEGVVADDGRLAEAKRMKREGDGEYRAAVPGSKDVNVHRRAALKLYTDSRAIYEELDRDRGGGIFASEIHDLNRNIAELRKDLPIDRD